MTPTQADLQLQEAINKLAETHLVLSIEDMERHMAGIDRMTRFYESKAPIAPPAQGVMFESFVSALMYAAIVIRMYRKLTRQLAELAEEKK